MATKIIEVHVLEYRLNTKPDYFSIGRKVDAEIEKSLPNGRYVCRAIGKDDHPDLSLNEFVEIVLKLGTDKYDPKRKEVCFEGFCMYDHDIQAGSFDIKNHKIILDDSYECPSMFGDIVKKFYENVLLDRGYRVRIDVLIIYNANKLLRAKKIDQKAEGARPELEKCLYKFKDPEHKQDALVGIVKILR
ncbi:hypothetical protein KKB10_02645 [Patescibacteria group bacterium]|nr:hypothetical protein [Patescibacteria group bacterium]MBU1951646.1 hypothetical protein [Patescibacteria group bacterium]